MPADVIEGGPDRPVRARRASASPVDARLSERIDAFEDAILRTRAGKDGEATHDLRVASRRLVAFVRAWRVLLPEAGFRRIVRELRAVRRSVGRARELEVQVQLMRERLERHGPPGAEALELLRELEGRLERRRRRAAKRVRPRRSKWLLSTLSRAEQDMSRDLVSRLQAFEVAHGRERERRLAAIDEMRASAEAGDDAALHRARIAIKKWRHAVESLGENEAPEVGVVQGQLRELQEVLGANRDRAALRTVLSRHLDGPGGRRVSRALSSMIEDLESERREEWERFHALARAFLRGVGQVPGGPSPSNPPPPAVRVSGG